MYKFWLGHYKPINQTNRTRLVCIIIFFLRTCLCLVFIMSFICGNNVWWGLLLGLEKGLVKESSYRNGYEELTRNHALQS
jgi:hypothetical protein